MYIPSRSLSTVNPRLSPSLLFASLSFLAQFLMNLSERRTEHSTASYHRARFHPYRRPVVPLEDPSVPYEPRIEDDTLLYLAFDVPSLSPQAPDDVPLEAEGRFNDPNVDGLGFWDLGLALFILLLLRHLLMLVLLQRRGGGKDDI